MRLVFRLLSAVVILILLAVVGVLMLPGERLAHLASSQLSKQLGREVTIQGDVSLTFWPTLSISTGPLEVANADWAGDTPLLSAQAARIGMDAAALLSGDITFRMIEADAPRITLITDADGRGNWELSTTEANKTEAAPAPSSDQTPTIPVFTLDRLRLSDASLHWRAAGADPVVMEGVELDLAWPDREGPATFDLTLRPEGDPVRIAATIGRPQAMMTGATGPLVASLDAPGGTAKFDGTFGTKPEAQGALSLDLADTARFLAALGIAGVDLPQGLGRKASGTGQITLSDGNRLALRDGKLTLDGNRLQAAADIALAAKPRITARLNADALDFSGLAQGGAGGSGGSGGGSGGSSGWSTAPFDASGLAAFDGEISLEAGAIDLGTLKLGKTRTVMTLDRSRAVFALNEVRAYDGLVTGEFVANNRNGLSVGGKLRASGVEMQTLLKDAADVSRFSGKADATLNFLGVGQSTAAIMSSLKGDGSVKAGPGRISGIDLDQLFRAGGVGGGTTVFDTLTASYTIAGGVLRNSDLLMSLPGITAEGEGKVNLGARTLDYLVVPTALNARDGRGLAIPVRIKGPWGAPAIRADMGEAIDRNLAEERKELEDKVRSQVSEKLEKELGVTVEQGDSIEDALQRKLEEEAAKGLLRLLGK
ncbi:AsmA family protein [Primorskyibacter flagellatus]|uniref:AsmA protein n=1 Tax=Primorskyibacter flagellatus TaxID=1387277 RepID=A0A1W2EHQ9_9RHOB|nr:AsmA family protein [Primorskyibacter flagellatus]SMD08708.1 AsmA protein [Primorskyibacter flagellatus]